MNDRQDSSSRGTPRRTDPALGNLDQLDAGADRRVAGRRGRPAPPSAPPPPPSGGRPDRVRFLRGPHNVWWLVLAIVVVVLAGGGAWIATHQATLSALLPQTTQLNTLLTRADKAYASGKLVGGPDSARSLYEAVQALDPDSERALTGLQNVGNAELKRAKAALKRHDYAAARASLEEARSLLGGGADVAAVNQELGKAVLRHANIDVLISQARAALGNGRIEGSNGAAALFGKVLEGDPDDPVARHGMDQVGKRLATRITTDLGNDDRAGAKKTLSELAAMLPSYSQLPDLRAAVAKADRAADAQRDEDIGQGQAYLQSGKLTGSDSDNAEAQFEAALAIDPDSKTAQTGLGQVAAALVAKANSAIHSGQSHSARTLLDQAAALAPKSADLAAARSRLAAGDAASASSAAAPAASAAAPALTAAQRAKLSQLVASAKAAAQKGDIMLPPGKSAYDLYSAALAIDGNDAGAQSGLRALPQITRDQFKKALDDDNLDRAHDMLATLDQLDPGDPDAASMRQSLGRAWLDRANHDATLGHSAQARTALAEAKQLIPKDPRIGEVSARIGHDN